MVKRFHSGVHLAKVLPPIPRRQMLGLLCDLSNYISRFADWCFSDFDLLVQYWVAIRLDSGEHWSSGPCACCEYFRLNGARVPIERVYYFFYEV